MTLVNSLTLDKDWIAPDFELKATDGQYLSLAHFLGNKALLTIFTCNHCPYAKAAWPILIDIHQTFQDDLEVVAINSNDATAYPDDSYSAMQDFVLSSNLRFPYLYDEDQKAAKTYQAQCTPDPYLFKISQSIPKLYYHGRINDNWQDSKKVTTQDLNEAITRLLNNQPPPEEQIPSMGCSIKWKN